MTLGAPGSACNRPTIHANACHHQTQITVKISPMKPYIDADRTEKCVGGMCIHIVLPKEYQRCVETHRLSVLQEGGGARLDDLATRVGNHEARATQLRVVGENLHAIEKTVPRDDSMG